MACLLFLRDRLAEITVLFANTGKNYPEALALVEKAKGICPNWIEVNADRDAQWSAHGLPSDLVPIDWTTLGQALSEEKPLKVQSYLGCCYENITGPLWAKTRELGAVCVIKGQRLDEAHKSTAKNGDVLDGVTFWHPIEHWTREQVLAYVRAEMGWLPEHYALDHSSMDCYDCTAFAAHSHDRAEYMRERHPALYADYAGKIDSLCAAMEVPMKHYQRLRVAHA